MKKIELLAPAGNLEKLKLAVIYGADAVFLGYTSFGLRSSSDNFTLEDIKEGVAFAKEYDVDVYVTTNIYAHQQNFIGFKDFVISLNKIGVRGLIISDPGYIKIAKEFAPNLEIHISTQQSITNLETVEFYESMGADRCVLARELTFEEISYISKNSNIEIEVFTHGAVCSSYSGRCTMSNHMTGRDSNRGGCCQSCRWNFKLSTLTEDGYKVLDRKQDVDFTMSAKDMQLLNYIPQMIETGADSLKIEGRMKSNHYVATVVGVYRTAIDAYYQDPKNYKVDPTWIEEIQKAEARTTYEGALVGDFSATGQIYQDQYNQNKKFDYCGVVLDYDTDSKLAKIQQRNYFKQGEYIEFFGPNNSRFMQKIDIIYNDKLEIIDKANHPLMVIYVKVDQPVSSTWMLRKEN